MRAKIILSLSITRRTENTLLRRVLKRTSHGKSCKEASFLPGETTRIFKRLLLPEALTADEWSYRLLRDTVVSTRLYGAFTMCIHSKTLKETLKYLAPSLILTRNMPVAFYRHGGHDRIFFFNIEGELKEVDLGINTIEGSSPRDIWENVREKVCCKK